MPTAALAPLVANESVNLFGHVVATRAFALGLVFGAFAYLGSAVLALIRRNTGDGVGVLFAAALVLSVRAVYGHRAAPLGLIVGLGLLAVGGVVASRAHPRIATAWYVGFLRTAVALVPGAAVLAAAFPVHDPSWVRLAVGAGVLVAAPLVHDFDAAQGTRGAPFLLLAVAVVAVYYTVPDPQLALVMLGCSVPLALLSFPQPLRKLGPSGSAAAVGAFMWVVAVGGRGRGGAAVAALATLGLLIVEPLARRVPRSTVALGKHRRQRSRQTDNWLLVVAVAAVVQLALGAFCAKIVGRETDPSLAALMVAPALVLVAAAAPLVLPVVSPGRHKGRIPRAPHSRRGTRDSRRGTRAPRVG